MKYLITGGAGFIGSHLADYLIEQGHYVQIIDNLSTGRLENIEHLSGHERFSSTIGSILDGALIEPLVAQCDQIFHLAAAVGVKLIMEYPVETIETNVQGTEQVLRLASQYSKKVLIASTSEVYGKSMKIQGSDRLKEDDDWTLGPTTRRRWAYACPKAISEFLALAYAEDKQLPVVIARFFNTVGPRQQGRYGMVIPRFVVQALGNKPIRVFGDGEQTRCFTYVGDAVRAIAALMNHPEAEGQIFNIGSDEELSINEVAARVRRLVRSGSEIVHVPYHEVYGPGFEDMRRRTPDLNKLQRMVDYRPSYTMDDILREVIHYYRKGDRRSLEKAFL